MNPQTNVWFDVVPPGTNNFGTETPRVNETGCSYGVNAVTVEHYMSIDLFSQCLDSPNVADQTTPKRKASEVARDRKSKKEIDKEYRLRCKAKKLKTEEDLVVLTEENNKLKGENSQSKKEEVQLQGLVQDRDATLKQLQRDFGQLKAQLDGQTTLVEVLSKQLASFKYIDLQRENKQLRLEKNQLMKKISNKDNLNMIQLEAKCTKLEQEKSELQVIIDALMLAKIKMDNKHDPE